ncbi:Pyruvate dehydrogenase E1 component subunit alpha [Alphaproteobacteria bacterium]
MDMHLDTAFLHECYEEMLLLRRFEEKAGQLYGMGLIGGFCHLYIGQEAVAVGVCKCMKAKDAIITSYRDHGVMLAIGSDPNVVMAELLGRETGCSKGKGGSMHMFDVPNGFYGGHGIVGAQVSIGTGIAFSFKYKQQNNVSIAMFGDGATNQGQVYESFNMAKMWNLPILYIIENNYYALGTSIERSTFSTDLYKRGMSFDILGKSVNGMDFISVYNATFEAIEYIKGGNGPMLLEMKTYRYRGHSMSDPAKYRTKEEVEKYKQKDPIEGLRKHMKDKNLTTDEQIKNIEKKVRQKVLEAAEFAQNSPEPAEVELYRNIYVN